MSGPSGSDAPLAVIFGASGGIGHALFSRLVEERRFGEVLGFCRTGDPPVDLTEEAGIATAAAEIAQTGREPRLIIDATGVLHGEGCIAEKSWRHIESAAMARAFAVNAIGPVLLMKHVLPLLPKAGRSIFATLSARVGSIGDNRSGGWYSYRASKAALNQLVRTASIELRRSRPEALCVALHPGTVATRLSAPFRKAGLEVRDAKTAAIALLDVLRRLSPGDSGGHFDHRARPVPW